MFHSCWAAQAHDRGEAATACWTRCGHRRHHWHARQSSGWGQQTPTGHASYPPLPTGNVSLGVVLAGAAWVAKHWSTISLRSRVASATAALAVSFTKDCTSCNALWFSSVRGRCCPAVGVGAPSGFSAIVAGRVLNNESVLLAWELPTLA